MTISPILARAAAVHHKTSSPTTPTMLRCRFSPKGRALRIKSSMANKGAIPNLGIGIGLRPVHYPEIFATWPIIDWFEIISENFLRASPQAMEKLERIVERYP